VALALVYDPRYHTWDSWACLMVEAYSGNQLSIPSGEDKWKEWATGLKAIELFNNDGIPGPDIFENWQDWALALVGAVNQPDEG